MPGLTSVSLLPGSRIAQPGSTSIQLHRRLFAAPPPKRFLTLLPQEPRRGVNCRGSERRTASIGLNLSVEDSIVRDRQVVV
jgi:hypothetical protein